MVVIQRKYSDGFTIIEILVSVLILAIGLLGLAGLQVSGLRSVSNADRYTQGTLAVNDMIERMRANLAAVNNNDFSAVDSANNIDCTAMPNPYCGQYYDGSNQVAAQGCNPQQMAAYDLNVWFCGERTGNASRAPGIVDIYPQAALTITCNDQNPASGADADPCTDGSPHTINFSWQEPNPNNDGGADLTRTIRMTFKPAVTQ